MDTTGPLEGATRTPPTIASRRYGESDLEQLADDLYAKRDSFVGIDVKGGDTAAVDLGASCRSSLSALADAGP
tara:strand:- start:607 stop:825 length:219 start_codon:yes stop_codon:yes gene_type:complete